MIFRGSISRSIDVTEAQFLHIALLVTTATFGVEIWQLKVLIFSELFNISLYTHTHAHNAASLVQHFTKDSISYCGDWKQCLQPSTSLVHHTDWRSGKEWLHCRSELVYYLLCNEQFILCIVQSMECSTELICI